MCSSSELRRLRKFQKVTVVVFLVGEKSVASNIKLWVVVFGGDTFDSDVDALFEAARFYSGLAPSNCAGGFEDITADLLARRSFHDQNDI